MKDSIIEFLSDKVAKWWLPDEGDIQKITQQSTKILKSMSRNHTIEECLILKKIALDQSVLFSLDYGSQ